MLVMFSGYDLIEWLMERFGHDETANGELKRKHTHFYTY